MGWTVIAPYILTYCNVIGHFDVLEATSSGILFHGCEIQKIQRIVDFVLKEHPSGSIDLYGISLGALDTRYKNIILSGAIIVDENYFWRQRFPSFNEYQRTWLYSALYGHTEPEDYLLNFLEDGGNKIVLEYGSYDLKMKKSKETLNRFHAQCEEKQLHCKERVFINFLKGYHETNPVPSLQFIQ